MRRYAGTLMMFLVTVVCAIGSYTVNLKVSAERAQVRELRMQLASDAGRIRELQAELRTRARLPEMQRWNDMVLHMAAPQARQFLRSPVELASFARPAETAPALTYAVTRPDAAVAPPSSPGVVTAAYAPPAPRPAVVKAAYAAPAPAATLAADIAGSLDAAEGKPD